MELTSAKHGANSKRNAFHPCTESRIFFLKDVLLNSERAPGTCSPASGCWQQHPTCVRRGDLILHFYLELFLYYKRLRSEEKLESRVVVTKLHLLFRVPG